MSCNICKARSLDLRTPKAERPEGASPSFSSYEMANIRPISLMFPKSPNYPQWLKGTVIHSVKWVNWKMGGQGRGRQVSPTSTYSRTVFRSAAYLDVTHKHGWKRDIFLLSTHTCSCASYYYYTGICFKSDHFLFGFFVVVGAVIFL